MPKEWAGRPVYAVSELLHLLASELEAAFPDVWVEGEVGGFKRPPSGHCYFALKDDRGALKTVLFKVHALRLGFEPENGMKVLARGRLSVYDAAGDLQLYASVLEPAGLGALQMAFEQAKKRLQQEGLTDPARKRPIPPFPGRVAIVTSLGGAALRDVLSVLDRRGASFEVVVVPSLVQGAGAPASLRAALGRASRLRGVDVIMLTRGGGSMEDRWCFNDEALARAVAACPLPVVSAVGHEVDTVLTDLTADLRAPTPSVAAELLTARVQEARTTAREASRRLSHVMRSRLFSLRERWERGQPERLRGWAAKILLRTEERADRAHEGLRKITLARVTHAKHRLDLCARALSPEAVKRWLDGLQRRQDSARARLHAAGTSALDRSAARFRGLVRLLHSLSPLAVLARGYAAAFGPGATPVTRAAQAPPGTNLSLAFRDGGIECAVLATPPSQLPASLYDVDLAAREPLKSHDEEERRG